MLGIDLPYSKDHFIRYRQPPNHQPKMTICIAAICRGDNVEEPKILFCNDSLVSAGIQYEGSLKYDYLTHRAVCLYSTNDGDLTEILIYKIKENIRTVLKERKISELNVIEIVEIVSKACIDFRNERIQNDIGYKYDIILSKIHENTDTIAKNMQKDLESYAYPLDVDFLIAGFDRDKDPHIFTVNQNGLIKKHDDSGFMVIGSGAMLAFSELTKYGYNGFETITEAILDVYFAKKSSERMVGVGKNTYYSILHYSDNVRVEHLNQNLDLIRMLDGEFDKLGKTEQKLRMVAIRKIEESKVLEPKTKP